MVQKSLNIASNCLLVSLSSILRLNTVDSKPAVLVEGNSNHVDVPLLHFGYGVIVIRAIKDPVATHTCKLGARMREPLQHYRLASLIVNQLVPLNVYPFHHHC